MKKIDGYKYTIYIYNWEVKEPKEFVSLIAEVFHGEIKMLLGAIMGVSCTVEGMIENLMFLL